MNECGFWFWFIRPFAEFAAFMSVFVPIVIVGVIVTICSNRKPKK